MPNFEGMIAKNQSQPFDIYEIKDENFQVSKRNKTSKINSYFSELSSKVCGNDY